MDGTVLLDRDQAARFMIEAAGVSGRAPWIHSTQPWRWQFRSSVADLYTQPSGHLPIADPDGRLMTLSCGTALHHPCVAIAGQDIAYEVIRFPDPGDTGHLATITATGRAPATPDALAMYRALDERHTDRRPLLAEPYRPRPSTSAARWSPDSG